MEWQIRNDRKIKGQLQRGTLQLHTHRALPNHVKSLQKIKKQPTLNTMKANTVAVISDGSAVLGLGNIGPYAAMPVMEGKCVLFKEFGDVNAVPICLDTQDTERDHCNHQKYCSGIRRHQSGGHLRSPVF